MMTKTAGVLLPLPLENIYSYRVPEGVVPLEGDVVEVPFGRRTTWGVIWSLSPQTPPGVCLKFLEKVEGYPRLPPISLLFIKWVAKYNLGSLGALLKMVLPVPEVLKSPKVALLYGRTREAASRERHASPARQRVFDYLDLHMRASLEDLQKSCGVRRTVLKEMVHKKWLEPVACNIAPLACTLETAACTLETIACNDASLAPVACSAPFRQSSPLILSESQKRAAGILRDHVQKKTFSVTLLEGVTGSGKTEVYFEALREALKQQKQVLVLLPEIALTTQWLQRFEKNFAGAPALWHGDLLPSQRKKTFEAIAKGQARVIVGARSALFLPYPDLGLIIVDEEHDSSYKQEEGFIYHARDMAVVRARLAEIPIILASATPSLETRWNVQEKRYGHVTLEDRYRAQFPKIQLVDLRQHKKKAPLEKPGAWIAPLLLEHLRETLEKGEQSLLYLNRRGYAPLLLCRLCGERLTCHQCRAWLVLHHQAHQLQCHHCGYRRPRPEDCQSCKAPGSLIPCGPGVERIAEEVAFFFPQARTAVMSRDTLSSGKKRGKLMEKIEAREVDILIGTQLIVKGHHFPYLTCVGVIDGDLSLSGGDPRACEKTYQLLHQVSGRAGRAEHPGHVFLQTYFPDHPVLQALVSGNQKDFIAKELQQRAAHRLPPFDRLAALILSGPQEDCVYTYCHQLAQKIPHQEGVDVFGPAPAPLNMLRGKFRWRFLVKAPRSFPLQAFLKTWLSKKPLPAQMRLQIDIDPYTFL